MNQNDRLKSSTDVENTETILLSTYEDKINFILDELKAVYLNDDRPWIIGYSGGKDSTVVVQLVFKMLLSLPAEQRKKHVYIVSSDTLVENPLVLAYLEQNSKLIGESAANLDLPLTTHMVFPEYNNSFWTNIIGKGFPTPKSMKFRWCTERLKIQPSNKFISEKVKESGEVIVLLGVRKAESITRKRRIENRQIDGYLLTPHVTLQNTYVYNPIVDLTTQDVWDLLLENNGRTPWNGDNNELFRLYMGSDSGECPFTLTTKDGDTPTPSCGNSRFGCWVCTVVKEDKSLKGFIENGEEWLIPLAEFREWIMEIRDLPEYRETRRRDGNIYYKRISIKNLPFDDNLVLDSDKIKNDENGEFIYSKSKDKIYLTNLPLLHDLSLDNSKIHEDEDNEMYINLPGFGPFNFKARQLILQKLLEIEDIIEIPLIREGELKEIDRIWDDEEDLTHRTLVDLYCEVKGKKLPWHDFKKPMFEKDVLEKVKSLSAKKGIENKLITSLLIETNKYKHYSNKTNYRKSIDKIMKQKWLHKDIEEIDL